MRNIKTPTILLIFTLLYGSCEGWLPCLEGDGNVVTEERIGSSFTGVEVNGTYDVRIESGTATTVMVTTDENLQRYIETTIKNGKLVIETNHDGCIEFNSATEVVITVPEITNITSMGSGNVEVSDFDSDFFTATQAGSGDIVIRNLKLENDIEINLIGSGNVWLKGKALNSLYVLSGSGNIDAESFLVSECTAMLSGSGNIHTYVIDLLKATIPGSGNVYYYGNTIEVIPHITGSGSVINASN